MSSSGFLVPSLLFLYVGNDIFPKNSATCFIEFALGKKMFSLLVVSQRESIAIVYDNVYLWAMWRVGEIICSYWGGLRGDICNGVWSYEGNLFCRGDRTRV